MKSKNNTFTATGSQNQQNTAGTGSQTKPTFVNSKQLADIAIAACDFYIDQNKRTLVSVNSAGSQSPMYAINSGGVMQMLRQLYVQAGSDDLADDALIKRAANALDDEARKRIEQGAITRIVLKKRVYEEVDPNTLESTIYWNTDVGNSRCIEITKDGWTPNVLSNTVRFESVDSSEDIQIPHQFSLDEAINYLPLFWEHMLIPEDMRIAYLAQLITAFFTTEDQPIGVYYSGGEGGDGKTPTARRTRDLIDPAAGGISPAPEAHKGYVGLLSGNYATALDDVNRKTFNGSMQTRLKTYQSADGGVETVVVLYNTNKTENVELKGFIVLTTNDRNLLIEDSTKRRSIVYEFVKGKTGNLSAGAYSAAYNRDLATLRGVLLALTVEVLKLLPNLQGDRNIHSLNRYSTVVQALEQILAGKLKPAIRQSQAKQEELDQFSEGDLLINDLETILNVNSGSFDGKGQELMNQLNGLLDQSDQKYIDDRHNDKEYPRISRSLVQRLKSTETIEALRLKGIEVLVDTKDHQSWVAIGYSEMKT